MSAEFCRRPGAFIRYLKNRRLDIWSSTQISFWEGRSRPHYPHGEPIALGRSSGDLVEGNMNNQAVMRGEIIYSIGDEKPTVGEEFKRAGITRETVGSHVLLDDSQSYQEQRLSEALRREREKTLTPRWRGYLRDVRAYLGIAHNISF